MPADPVDAVLFDLDDTLCTYRRDGAAVLSAAFERANVEPFFDAADYRARYREFAAETDTIAELRRECFAAVAADRGRDPEEGLAVARAYTAERDQTNVRALPGAREAVRALADDHAVGLVTNGAPGMQRTKLGAVGLADAFETVVFAGYDTPPKPEPDPFGAALSDLGVAHDRAVHVGNSPRSDVAGARAAGVRQVWLREDGRSPDDAPDWTVDSLSELVDPPWR